MNAKKIECHKKKCTNENKSELEIEEKMKMKREEKRKRVKYVGSLRVIK